MGGLDHEVILVELDGNVWVCDAGFGGQTPRAPVQLADPPLPQADIPGEGEPLCHCCSARCKSWICLTQTLYSNMGRFKKNGS